MLANSAVTWTASSRVGTSTRADGRGSAADGLSTMGSANASVLPDPVGDFARMSRPAMASLRTSAWISNGAWMSRLASAWETGSDRPSSWNDGSDTWSPYRYERGSA